MNWRLTDAYDEYGDFSEDDVRVRPPRRGTKPRTKQRPTHDDAISAFVTTVDRGRYTCVLDADTSTRVIAATARELGRKAVVVGDRVALVGDVSGAPGSLARIVRVEPRETLLRRSADDTDQVERIIVANADQLCVVVAAMNPEPRPRLIDRYLIAAYDAGIEPLLVITKTDLHPADELRALVQPLDVPVFTSALGEEPSDELLDALAGHTTVMVGHSGVGKSTLVNALVPDADRATGHVNAVTGRGRHTSSSSLALQLPEGGWIIDTPGVRSFGLGHVDNSAITDAFPLIAATIAQCPRGCTHRSDSPDCALDVAIASGQFDELSIMRVGSIRRLIDSLSPEPSGPDASSSEASSPDEADAVSD